MNETTKPVTIRSLVRDYAASNRDTWFSSETLAIALGTVGWNVDVSQISSACSQLHAKKELKRRGERGTYEYSFQRRPARPSYKRRAKAIPAVSSNPGVNPIEDLLDAMARAEPALRQLAAAHAALMQLKAEG